MIVAKNILKGATQFFMRYNYKLECAACPEKVS